MNVILLSLTLCAEGGAGKSRIYVGCPEGTSQDIKGKV